MTARLQVGEREGALAVEGLEVALRRLAPRVVLHLQRDRLARLRPATDVIELEAHQRLDERALAVGLPTDDDDGGRVDGH